MQLEKKPTRRALKTPTIVRAPTAIAKPVPVPAAKPKRVAKNTTEAQPQVAPKPKLVTKIKRPTRSAATAMKPKRPAAARKARQPKLEIPAILLAGDTSAPAGVSGPGQRYALGPTTPPAHAGRVAESGELPEAYGTTKLWLTARDPQWLYAHWDLSSAQLRDYNAQSDDGHLVVRVFEREALGEPLVTQHVHPESRNWFIHVGRGGTKFVAQLGYFDRKERWQTIAISAATITPPDSLSEDTSAEFGTLPVEVPFDQLVEMVKSVIGQHVPLMEALAQLREQGHPNLPTAETFAPPRARSGHAPSPTWTRKQAEALEKVVTMNEVRRVWIDSLEITELVRRQLAKLAASGGALGLGSPSSPFGGLGSPQGQHKS